MTNEKQKPERKGISGLVFVGCLMLGLAIGFLTGNIAAGLFGGLGVGFIGMAIVRYITGEW
jgi:predicted lipid-binding transport protein (Tim44 family)